MKLAEQDSRPSTESVRNWLKNVDVLTKLLKRDGDKESIQLLSDQRQKLRDMFDAMGVDSKGRNKLRASHESVHITL